MASGGGACPYACWDLDIAGSCCLGRDYYSTGYNILLVGGSCIDGCLLVVGVGGRLVCSADGCLLDHPGGSFGYGLWLLLGDFFCLRLHYIFF